MSTGFPSTTRNPVGEFIQAFAKTTKIPEMVPLTAMATPAHQWARSERRCHHTGRSEEDRLGEEGESLERERHPDDRPRVLHERGPEETQLE